MVTYRSPSTLPSILQAIPGPSHIIHPHTITDPPPNFTVPCTSLSLKPSPAFFQAHFLPSDPRRFILVSSDHTTLFQASTVYALVSKVASSSSQLPSCPPPSSIDKLSQLTMACG